jgi:guanylate kinase
MKISKFIIFFCAIWGYAGETKFLLLLGPSGIGKSTVIRQLQELDPRFIYIKPFTTRPLRNEERDKIHISVEELLTLRDQNRLVALNHLYGNYYGTPLDPIEQAFKEGNFPVLDWPVQKMETMRRFFDRRLVSVYLYVEETEEMAARLEKDSRDQTGERFSAGRAELVEFFRGDFDGVIDYKIRNEKQEPVITAGLIYDLYLKEAGCENFPQRD